MDKDSNFKIETLLSHNPSDDNPSRALSPPIAQTATFYFDTIKQVNQAFNFETDDYVYTRGNNPTLRLFEEKMAVIENGKAACAFSSGMGAISSVLLSLLKPEDKAIFHRTLYGSSHTVAKVLLRKYNIKTEFANMTNLKELEKLIDDGVKVIYFETPSNPNLELIDIQAVKKLIGKKDIKIVVDNTFLSPYFQNPLDLGADIVVHSATKYISGHGDVVAGVAVSKDIEYIHKLKFEYMTELGSVMSPFNAWLLLRGLKTLHVRMDRHEKNAIEVAQFLNTHPKVKKLTYPGLDMFPYRDIVKRQIKGYGAIICFEITGTQEETIHFVESLKLFKIAVSLGDIESLVEIPAAMTHIGYVEEKLVEFGLSKKMVRLSIGLENSADLISDLEYALKEIQSER